MSGVHVPNTPPTSATIAAVGRCTHARHADILTMIPRLEVPERLPVSYCMEKCRLGSSRFRPRSATIRRRRSKQCNLACQTSLGAFWGLRYRRWGVGHLGLAACPAKLLQGGRPTTQQQAHASAAPDTKPDHDMHGGPAGCVHIFINAKVTVSMCKDVCIQLTCQCVASNDCVHALTQNMEAVVRA